MPRETYTIAEYTDGGLHSWAAIRAWDTRTGAPQTVLTWHDSYEAAENRVRFWATVFGTMDDPDFALEVARRFKEDRDERG